MVKFDIAKDALDELFECFLKDYLLMSGSPSLEDRVATLVHAHFDALPRRSKPNIHGNGKREWIPLSGIVLVTGEKLVCFYESGFG